jgi:hypothetical protein
VGATLLAVVLSDQAHATLGSGAASSGGLIQTLSPTVRAHVAGPLASAFGSTLWWALGATLIALIPASVLAVTQRREREATDIRAAGGGGLTHPTVRTRLALIRSSAIQPAPQPAGATRSERLSIRPKRSDKAMPPTLSRAPD